MVVLGALKSSKPRGVLFGSVSHAVVHYAPCPVAVVR